MTPFTRNGTASLPTVATDAWRALLRLALVVLLAMAPWFTTAAIVGPLRVAWRLSPADAAWLTIAAQIGFVAGALVSALLNLADLVRPRYLMLAGGLAAAAANIALAECHSFGGAWPWRFATGACLALVYPPALKLMATWFRARRGAALGMMVGALTVGAALPHLVNALGGADWRQVVVWTSAITALGGILGGLLGQEGPFPFARARFNPGEIATALADRKLRLAMIGYLGHMWEMIAMWSWLSPFLATVLVRRAPLAAFAAIGVGGVGCWVGGMLSDSWSRERAAATCLAISGACALSLGWLQHRSPLVVLILASVWGFFVVADSAQFSVLVTELADPRYVGTALTLQLGGGFTLAAVTVWLIPFISTHWGWGWAFSVLALGPLIGITAMRILERSRASAFLRR
jgi:sugar phosphate permease